MLKRIFCALLASMMLIGSMAACATPNGAGDDTTANTQPNAGTTSESTESGAPDETKATLDIPATKYDGEELVFLTRDESEWSTFEIYAEDMTANSDNINNAVYERNLRILETYGVTIKEMKTETGKHGETITKEISGSTGDFAAIVSNTLQSASWSSQGYLWNLHAPSIEHLDLTKPWWDQNMAEGLSINNRVYFATGDLLTADNDATFAILFNKKIAQDNRLEDLYSLVSNNEWTMEKFYDFASKCVADRDGYDGLSYDTDVSGFAYTGDNPYCFLFAGGITLCTKNEDDIPVYSLDVNRAESISVWGDRIFDKAHAIDLNAATVDGPTIMQVGQICFGEDHALFLGEVMQAVTRMRGYDVDFGILPFPKYDTMQKDYYSMMHLTASMVSIPKSVSGTKLEMTTAMIEAMAYHSVDTLTEQYYEINLKTKGAKDEKSGPMIDMILASRACDLSYYYQWGDNAFGTVAGTLLPSNTDKVTSITKSYSRKLERIIDKVVTTMDNNAKDE